ncbi:nuclear transport factor 2 family protein [Paenibacillus hamazuiensis]|uniref:nuclear transport factor 2 family protein n=1 Tax=Paenibacillus hamazuiensis TaxID=2936508 RepID=UPI00200F3C2F|nr:nuclear transport factor 2 family protein [Paenibacillus hamazuiensis]
MKDQQDEPDYGNFIIPPAVQVYMESANRGDLRELTACFSDSAVILDMNREIIGKSAIKAWAGLKVIGYRYEALFGFPLPHGARVLMSAEAPGTGRFHVWYTFRIRENQIIFADLQTMQDQGHLSKFIQNVWNNLQEVREQQGYDKGN